MKRLSSDRLRFFLSLKYCIDFFTMLARRIFAGELFCNGNEKTSCCKTSQIWHSLVSHLMLLNSISSRTRRTSYPTFLTIFPILLGNSAVKVNPTCFNLLFAGRFSSAVVLLESVVVDCTIWLSLDEARLMLSTLSGSSAILPSERQRWVKLLAK